MLALVLELALVLALPTKQLHRSNPRLAPHGKIYVPPLIHGRNSSGIELQSLARGEIRLSVKGGRGGGGGGGGGGKGMSIGGREGIEGGTIGYNQ